MQPEKSKFESLANELFEVHPETDVFYFTTDINAFKVQHEAYNHSLKLKDQTIIEIYHPEISAAEIKTRKAQQSAELQANADDAYKRAFPEIARSIEYNKSTYRK